MEGFYALYINFHSFIFILFSFIHPIVQNSPGSDVDGLVRVWPNASGLEASRCAGIIWPGFWQDATGPLPASHFRARFRSSTDVPDNTVPNQPGSDLVLADCVRFWPNGSGPEASRCATIIRPASGQCFPADPDRMRIGSGMFTVGLHQAAPTSSDTELYRIRHVYCGVTSSHSNIIRY